MTPSQQKLIEQLSQLGDVVFIKNPKESFIRAVSKMDLATLDLILEDNISYQDTTKTIFIEKLGKIFRKLNKKNSFLIPSEGKCCSEECSNKNNLGVSFTGDKTGDYFSFIIEQNENGSIKDIYNCYEFCTDKNSISENNRQYGVTVYEDEKIDFKPSATFTYLNEKCSKAIYEINRAEEDFISSKEIINWINNYKSLYCSFNLPPILFKTQNSFYNLYTDVKKIGDFLNFEEVAIVALDEFEKINLGDDIQILKWLLIYDELHNKIHFNNYGYITKKNRKKGYKKISKIVPTRFKIDIMQNCIQLSKILNEYYNEMLNKYNTSVPEDLNGMSPFDEEYDNYYSLKYHLEKRGII